MEEDDSGNSSFIAFSPSRKVLADITNTRSADEGNPLSPTANLKLLTKVATYTNKVKDCVYSETISNLKKVRREFPLQYAGKQIKQIEENSKSRKEKSLSLLCHKFLHMFPLGLSVGDHMMISLDETVKKLGTERRRIYDIINVLESLQMASKVGKNRYVWYGRQQLNYTLAQLKGLAVLLGMREQLEAMERKQNVRLVRVVDDLSDDEERPKPPVLTTPRNQDVSMVLDGTAERSLGVMCQKFMMLFLVCSKHQLLTLDLAANILLREGSTGDDQVLSCCEKAGAKQNFKSGQFNTKVRRLYDIANMLSSLGLIRKLPNCDNSFRKPAFEYIGPQVEPMSLTDQDVQLLQSTRHSLLGSSPSLCCVTPEPAKKKSISKTSGGSGKFARSYSESWSRPVNAEQIRDEDVRPLSESSLTPEKRKQFEDEDSRSQGTDKKEQLEDEDVQSQSEIWSGSEKTEQSEDSQSQSENCLRPEKRKHPEEEESSSSLNEILHVAEMELQRLESMERTTNSARKKLFTRHHSEPCIATTSRLVRVDPSQTSSMNDDNVTPPASSVMLHVQPSTVIRLPVMRPAIVFTPPPSRRVVYRLVRVVELLPQCNNSVN